MAKVNKVTTNGTTYELQDYDLNNSLSGISGIVKSAAGSLSEAVAGTDYDYPVLKGTGVPTTSTEGALGQHYLNTSAKQAPYEWVCVKVSGSTYTWVEVGSGSGGGEANITISDTAPESGNVWIDTSEDGGTSIVPDSNGTAPTIHASQHAIGGTDSITPKMIGAAPAYYYGQVDLIAGQSALPTGVLYFVYEGDNGSGSGSGSGSSSGSGSVQTITFILFGLECIAEEGMAWIDWIESDYYTSGLSLETSGSLQYVRTPEGYVVDSLSNRVSGESPIIAGEVYDLSR